jgi:hypothetical protein
VGERLGVGVTLVLTIEISRASLQHVVPICGELLWLEMFFLLNLAFTVCDQPRHDHMLHPLPSLLLSSLLLRSPSLSLSLRPSR